MSNINTEVILSEEVKAAKAAGKPIVALESTIISHGMPYPENVDTAKNCERIARENGAVPATIAIIGGRMHAGLTAEQLDYFGRTGTAITKASRRDLPVLLAKGMDGATTVAATMIIAKMAGISIFATGGIGGVHRGAQQSMDISADLEELAKTNVNVICAGCKSILDIGLTREYLETKGVCVVGYRTDEMPAFYTRSSGYSVDYRMDTAQEIADVISYKAALGYSGGMLIANPIPEDKAMPKEPIDEAINNALKEAEQRGIVGKDITPFLLGRVKDLTGGSSLESNIALVYNNVALAAQIAAAMLST